MLLFSITRMLISRLDIETNRGRIKTDNIPSRVRLDRSKSPARYPRSYKSHECTCSNHSLKASGSENYSQDLKDPDKFHSTPRSQVCIHSNSYKKEAWSTCERGLRLIPGFYPDTHINIESQRFTKRLFIGKLLFFFFFCLT
jgi:hypothetical protein